MTIEIPFQNYNKSDIQLFFYSDVKLNEDEKREKEKCLDTLCNLVNLTEIGYSTNQEAIISVSKKEDCLLLEINDKFIS